MKIFQTTFRACLLCLLAALCAGLAAHGPAARDYKPVDSLGQPQTSGLPPPRAAPRQAPQKTAASAPKPAPAQPNARQGAYVSPSGAVLLFGKVEMGRPLSTLPGWLDVIARNEASPIFQAGRHFNKTTSWESLKARLEGLDLRDQLREVNKFWNAWPYREDRPNWGKDDYWEIPAEFLRKSGDCEDYAIVKYFTLKELGVDPKSMRIVVLRDTVRNLAHAVLAVYTDQDALVLDNLSNSVLSHRRLANYDPQYSVNEFGRWMHMKGKRAR